MLTLSPAQFNFSSNGIPRSAQFNDNYYSQAGALKESQHVFIAGNQITKAWINHDQFTIAELGFGLGINFIATANTWLASNQNNAQLNYISIEKHPVSVEQMKKVFSKLDLHSEITRQLVEEYPLAIRGSNRIHFSQANITLTLIWDDVLYALKNANFKAHAWYLDGFSPKHNQSMWSREIANHVHRLTMDKGTFATYSSAKLVQENFSAAGFIINKQPGCANKREMLVGMRMSSPAVEQFSLKQKSWLFTSTQVTKNKTAIVIGAGMAGVAISGALAQRGWQVTLIDQHDTVAQEASGNSNAILMPRLSIDHDLQAQLTLQGFFYSLRYLKHLQSFSNENFWQQCGAIQIPRNKNDWQRMQQIIRQENIPPEFMRFVTQQEASDLANCSLTKDAWYFPQAAWCVPKLICQTILQQYKQQISFLGNNEVESIRHENGVWHAVNKNQQTIAPADIAIVTSAYASNQFKQTNWCTLHAKRGQITLIPNTMGTASPQKIICADAYITPAVDNQYVLGATFITDDTDTDVRLHEHEQNLSKLAKITPSFKNINARNVIGRAAIRAVSPDRLPIVGPVSDQAAFFKDYKSAALGSTNQLYPAAGYMPGLYIATGFGSRGMAWIPLCAEALACTINGEAGPLDLKLAGAIHPNRLLMKQLISQTKK